jgi:hypothetical protein
MYLENKALIYCILGSHNEVLMHYLGLNNSPFKQKQTVILKIDLYIELGRFFFIYSIKR